MSGKAFLRRIWVLMAIVFVDMVGFLVVLPLLPFYAENMGASATTVGALISVFAFAQLTTSPFWGKLSDHSGRRPMILLGLLTSAAAYLLFGLATTVWVLLVSRVVQGIGAGINGVVQAYVSDAAPPGQRTQAIGWVTVATSAGVMVGPAVGSLATLLGESAPGFIAAGLCLLNLLFAWFFLPESFTESDKSAEGSGEAVCEPAVATADGAPSAAGFELSSIRRAITQVLWHPGRPLATLIWIYAFSMMAFMAMNGVVALYLERVFDVSERSIGGFYVYVGAVSVLMRAFVLGPVVHRLGDVRTLRLGALSIAIGLGLLPLASNLWTLALVVLFVPVGTALLFPATTSLVSQHSRPRDVGQNLGVQQAFGGVARMLGPLWATAAFQYLSIASPFWISGGLMLLAAAIALTVRSGLPHRSLSGESEPFAKVEPTAPEGL